MPNWVHRTTKRFTRSVASADLAEPVANYIEDPDLSAVTGFPSKYWIITGDVITLMDQASRDAVDAAEDTQTRVDLRADAVVDVDDATLSGMELRAVIETLNKRDNYLTNRVVELQAALDAIKASTGQAQSIRDAIPASWLATNTRPRSDAVQDYKDDINAGNVDT